MFVVVLVFATLIVGFIIVLPIYKKVEYYISRERKRDIALSRGHVLDAKLVKYRQDFDESDTGWRDWYTHATYEYVVDDWHYENHKAIILIPLGLSPWFLAALVLYLLKLHLIVVSW